MTAAGTTYDPWELTTPPGSSSYTMHRDEAADPPALVCQVGSTTRTYHLSAIEDLHAWLLEQDDWVLLGAVDEKKEAGGGNGEAWGRAPDNPVGGWYRFRNGYCGRFGMYLPRCWRPSGSLRSPTTSGTTPCEVCRAEVGGSSGRPGPSSTRWHLAHGTHMGPPARDGALDNGGATAPAGLTGPAVDGGHVQITPPVPPCVDIITQGRAASGDAGGQDGDDPAVQGLDLGSAHGTASSFRMEPGVPECFVGVDVPDTGHR